LKAGGAYTSFDLLAPEARLAGMVNLAKIDLVVTRESVRARLPALGVRTISLDGEEAALAERPDDRPVAPVPAEGLACVMYTSGSTGEPKGVAVTHRNIVRLVRGAAYATFGPD